MRLLDRLEDAFGKYAIPNITYFLIGGQVLAFILIKSYPDYASVFVLNGGLVVQGQWWRLITFLIAPISSDFIVAIFSWYLYYLYGVALERLWGSFRYITYLLIAYIGTVVLAFAFPTAVLSNIYMYTSVFLAFAYRFPDFELMLFFIIPVKVKWLALLAWIGMLGAILFGSIPTKVQTVVSIINFLVFFGDEIVMLVQRNLKGSSGNARVIDDRSIPYHVCAVCHDNEVKNPKMEIRYCRSCIPSTCYCGKHIHDHTHKTN